MSISQLQRLFNIEFELLFFFLVFRISFDFFHTYLSSNVCEEFVYFFTSWGKYYVLFCCDFIVKSGWSKNLTVFGSFRTIIWGNHLTPLPRKECNDHTYVLAYWIRIPPLHRYRLFWRMWRSLNLLYGGCYVFIRTCSISNVVINLNVLWRFMDLQIRIFWPTYALSCMLVTWWFVNGFSYF